MDADVYSGSGVGNMGSVLAEETPWHGQPASATISLPPLGALWLTPAEPDPVGQDPVGRGAGEPGGTCGTMTGCTRRPRPAA